MATDRLPDLVKVFPTGAFAARDALSIFSEGSEKKGQNAVGKNLRAQLIAALDFSDQRAIVKLCRDLRCIRYVLAEPAVLSGDYVVFGLNHLLKMTV